MASVRSRVMAAGLLALAGCAREAPAPAVTAAAAEPAPAPTPAPVPVAVQPPAPQPPAPPPPPPVFPFPTDAAGKELPKVVAPRAPAPLPIEKFGKAPTDRTPPARVVHPDSLGKATYTPPPALPPRPTGFPPPAPAERVPFDLGVGIDVPARPALAVAKSEPVIAKDVTIPPPLPPGQPLPDRASLEDPSAEPSGAVIVARSVNPPLGLAEFLRLTLPDPFELAAQVKPVVPPAADPGLAPVVVTPMRPR